MTRLTSIAIRSPRLGWILIVVLALVAAACNNGSGSGY
jgi:predicted small secreted protein